MPPKDPKLGTTNHWYAPGHSWATPGVYLGNLCDSYMDSNGTWNFSDLLLMAGNDNEYPLMIDVLTKQFVPKEKVMSCCLGAKKVVIQSEVAANFLDEAPSLFEGVEVEFV